LKNRLIGDRPDMFEEGRQFELRYQGKGLVDRALVPVDGPPIQIEYLTASYTFRIRDKSVTEWCDYKKIFGQLRASVTKIFKQDIQGRPFISFILGGIPFDWNIMIGSVPASSTIDLMAWKREQFIYHKTAFDLISARFGDLRTKYADAPAIFQCRGRTEMTEL
jgi:hypothetical protein